LFLASQNLNDHTFCRPWENKKAPRERRRLKGNAFGRVWRLQIRSMLYGNFHTSG
jgi:hypothetical protein